MAQGHRLLQNRIRSHQNLWVDDGDVVVAQFPVGRSNFWLADEPPEHKNFSPGTLGGASTSMVLVFDDPDAVFKQAVAAGAQVV